MHPRIECAKAVPEAIEAMRGLDAYVERSGLEPELVGLVKIRARRINGCAYCIDMHTKDARAAGETERHLYALDAWRETPFYTNRQQAALAWTEAMTEVSDEHVPEEVYDLARRRFTEKELIDLTLASSPSAGGAGSRSAARRCRAPMIARRREDKTSEQLLVLMLDGDDGTPSMIQVQRLAEFVVRDSYEDHSAEAIRELKMRILDTLRCAIGAPARDFKARDPGPQGSLGQDSDLQRLDREAVIPSAFPDGFWGQRGYSRFNSKEV